MIRSATGILIGDKKQQQKHSLRVTIVALIKPASYITIKQARYKSYICHIDSTGQDLIV